MFTALFRIKEMNKNTAHIKTEYDEDDKLLINMQVRDDSNFLSPFSQKNSPIISNEVASFLLDSVKPKDSMHDMHIKIYSDVVDDDEKHIYKIGIKNYFDSQYIQGRQKIKRDVVISLIMLLFGIIVLGGMVLLDHFGIQSIALEIVDILAWVFLWEAADIFFLQRFVTRHNQQKYISLSKAKITFMDLDSKKS